MFAKRFAEFVLQKRINAILMALLFAALPFFGWVSGVVVALVTLRKGVAEGSMIMLWSVLPAVVMVFHGGSWMPLVGDIFLGSVMVWIMAALLRRYVSWSLLIYCLTLLGLFVVVGIHLTVGDVPAWWLQHFAGQIQQVESSVNLPANTQQEMSSVLKRIAQVAIGLQVMMYSLSVVFEIFIARGLETLLDRSEQLRQECCRIRMNIFASLVLVACAVLSRVGPPVYLDMLPVILLPFILAGISLIHAWMRHKKVAQSWYFTFYTAVLLATLLLPTLLLFIVFVGLVDSIVNFRERWQTS